MYGSHCKWENLLKFLQCDWGQILIASMDKVDQHINSNEDVWRYKKPYLLWLWTVEKCYFFKKNNWNKIDALLINVVLNTIIHVFI